jgi:hypothetical protein
MLTQNKTALLAAALLIAARLYLIVERIPSLAAGGGWMLFIGECILPLALPAALIVYWRSGAVLALSRGLRRAAMVSFAVLGGFCAALPILMMLAFLALGARAPFTAVAGWRLLFLVSQLALGLFLVALTLAPPSAARDAGASSRMLEKVALAAIVAGVMTLIASGFREAANVRALLILQGHDAPYYSGPNTIQAVMAAVIGLIPEICRVLVPVIIYMGLPRAAEVSSAPESASPEAL